MSIKKQALYSALLKAIHDLQTLHTRTAAPQPLPHQYVGTAIDATLSSLFTPLNTLWLHRPVRPVSDESAWLSSYNAMLRTYYVLVHLGCEEALKSICSIKSIPVASSTETGARKLADTIRPFLKLHPEALEALDKLSAPRRPSFDDYLNAVLTGSNLPQKSTKHWRKFFVGLGVLRNKSAHGNTQFTQFQKQALIDAALAHHIAEDQLVMNVNSVFSTSQRILDFFDAMSASYNLPPGPMEPT